MPAPIAVTAEAKAALDQLRAANGPIVLHLTGGCCDARTPLCLKEDELRLGPRDVLFGKAGDVPVYEMTAGADQEGSCALGAFELALVDGLTVGFSLEAAPGKRFSLRTVA